jgi:hypothetical protein
MLCKKTPAAEIHIEFRTPEFPFALFLRLDYFAELELVCFSWLNVKRTFHFHPLLFDFQISCPMPFTTAVPGKTLQSTQLSVHIRRTRPESPSALAQAWACDANEVEQRNNAFEDDYLFRQRFRELF